MTIALPNVIAAFFAADRSRDPDAVSRCFADTAVVTDEGRSHVGQAAIRDWMAKSTSEFSYTVEPFAIDGEGDAIVVTSHLVGNFPGSPVDLRYFFKLAGDSIASLEIKP